MSVLTLSPLLPIVKFEPYTEANVAEVKDRRGLVIAICIGEVAKGPMRRVEEAKAIAGRGLEGDRYARAEGSFSKGQLGKRQVTLINALFFVGSGFEYEDTRRNIVTIGTELMDLIGKKFIIGDARMKGLKYCDPCKRPSTLTGNPNAFDEVFHDRGGLVAEILQSGLIRVGDAIIPPLKDY